MIEPAIAWLPLQGAQCNRVRSHLRTVLDSGAEVLTQYSISGSDNTSFQFYMVRLLSLPRATWTGVETGAKEAVTC